MKLLLLLLASAALHAAPIFHCEGYCSAIPGGFALDLNNLPGMASDRTAEIVSDVALSSARIFLDTLPEGIGTGLNITLDGVLIVQTPPNVLVHQWFDLANGTQFTRIGFSTNVAQDGAVREHLTAIGMSGIAAVPEPGTWKLVIAAFALVAVWGRVVFLSLRLIKHVDQGGDVNDKEGR